MKQNHSPWDIYTHKPSKGKYIILTWKEAIDWKDIYDVTGYEKNWNITKVDVTNDATHSLLIILSERDLIFYEQLEDWEVMKAWSLYVREKRDFENNFILDNQQIS